MRCPPGVFEDQVLLAKISKVKYERPVRVNGLTPGFWCTPATHILGILMGVECGGSLKQGDTFFHGTKFENPLHTLDLFVAGKGLDI